MQITYQLVSQCISAPPAAPIVNPVTACAGELIILSAIAPGAEILWYTTPTGGSPFFIGANYQPPPLNSSTDFFVESVIASCTSATRTRLSITIIERPPVAVIDSVNPVCSGDSAVIFVKNITGIAEVNWFSTQSGGLPFFTGNPLIVRAVQRSTVIWAETKNDICVSAARTAAKITVLAPPIAPDIFKPPFACSNQPVSISAGGSEAYLWYADSNKTTLLSDKSVVTINVGTKDTVVWITNILNGCTATVSIPVVIPVQISPYPVIIDSFFEVCKNSSLSLKVDNKAGNIIYWFKAADGFEIWDTGSVLNISKITENLEIWPAYWDKACYSPRKRVKIYTTGYSPAVPKIAGDTIICKGGYVTLLATSDSGSIAWYADTNALPILGAKFEISGIEQDRFIFVRAENGDCVSDFRKIKLIAYPPAVNVQMTVPEKAELNQAVVISGNGNIDSSWRWNFGAGAVPLTAQGAGPHLVTYRSIGKKRVELFRGDSPCNELLADTIVIDYPAGNEIAANETWLTLFPNPVVEKLSLMFSEPIISHIQWQLYDGVGRLIGMSENLLNINELNWDFSAKPAGIYWLVINTAGKSKTFKVIKY